MQVRRAESRERRIDPPLPSAFGGVVSVLTRIGVHSVRLRIRGIDKQAGGARRFPTVALLLAGCCFAVYAPAATITVDTLADEIDAGCSLRAAIVSANLDASPEESGCVSGSGRDRIVFSVTGFLALNEPLPDLLDEIDIAGPGPETLTIDAGGSGSVLTIAGSGVSVSGLALTSGNAPFGGGLRVGEGAAVTVANVDIYSNVAAQGGGGVASNGTLAISDSTIRDNTATGGFGGGGIYSSAGATLNLTGSAVTDNDTGGGGGGLFIAASAAVTTLEGLEVRGNSAGAGGGGILAAADLAISASVIAENSAGGAAEITVVGGGIQAGGDVTATAVTVSGNSVTGGSEAGAGGIYAAGDVVATGSRIEGNKVNIGDDAPTRDVGGGILAAGVWLIDSTVAENATRAVSGAGGSGSAVHAGGDAIIANSTISDNSADDAPGRAVGAILLSGATSSSALANSTVSGNRSRDAAVNLAAPASSLSVLNSTITGNHGNGSGLAGIRSAGVARLANTIVFSNDVDCRTAAGGSLVSVGYNIDGDGSCALTAGGDQPDSDPLLGPLADNGGPTSTHALLGGSPAIDAGDAGQCPETDQRGVPRSEDGDLDGAAACDIGAFEYQAEDLRIGALSADADAIAVGDRVRIEVAIANAGRSAVGGVVLTIGLSAALGFADAPAGCSEAGGIVSCDLGTMNAGATVEVAITVDSETAGSATVEAVVTGDVNDSNPDNDVAQLTLQIENGGAGPDDDNDAGGDDDGNGDGDGDDALPLVSGGSGAFPPVVTGLLLAMFLRRRGLR